MTNGSGALSLSAEVTGCPTLCRHCWAQGRAHPTMPVADVAWLLERVHRFCDERGLAFGTYPMHEVAVHPEAPQVLKLFAEHGGSQEFEPLSTTGVPLATRQDWWQVLEAARGLGTTTVWLAFHGLEQEHDRLVARPGAYAESCLAAERVHEAGMRVPAPRDAHS